MIHKTCTRCGKDIPAMRLEALPETMTCMGCSRVRAKTELDIEVDAADPNELRNAVSNQENY